MATIDLTPTPTEYARICAYVLFRNADSALGEAFNYVEPTEDQCNRIREAMASFTKVCDTLTEAGLKISNADNRRFAKAVLKANGFAVTSYRR